MDTSACLTWFSQWEFQDPIHWRYLPYIWDLFFRPKKQWISPENMAPNMVRLRTSICWILNFHHIKPYYNHYWPYYNHIITMKISHGPKTTEKCRGFRGRHFHHRIGSLRSGRHRVIHGPNGGEPTKWDRISTANDVKKRNKKGIMWCFIPQYRDYRMINGII